MSLMRGRHIWSGYLAADNYEQVGQIVGRVLSAGPFTMVTVNSGMWDNEPEARSGRTLKECKINAPEGEHPSYGFTVVDDDYVTGVHGWEAMTEREARAQPERRQVRLEITDRQVCVRLFAPAGHRLYWLWTLEGDAYATNVAWDRSGCVR